MTCEVIAVTVLAMSELKLKPRRRPQGRSAVSIVTAILDAASSLLVESGLGQMTTNAIAKRAGISVGSLYQYFPNKHAVCAGIAGRVNERLIADLRDALATDAPPDEQLDAIVAVLCSSEIGSHAVRGALLEYVPRIWEETLISSTEQSVETVLAPLFRGLAPSLGAEDLAERQQVATFAVRGAVQSLLLKNSELLGRDTVRAWLRDMVLAVLRS